MATVMLNWIGKACVLDQLLYTTRMSHESFEDALERVLAEEKKNPPGIRSAEKVAERNSEIFRRAMEEDD